MKYQVFLIIAITFCISAWAKVPPSAAGESALDLRGVKEGYYYAEDEEFSCLNKKQIS